MSLKEDRQANVWFYLTFHFCLRVCQVQAMLRLDDLTEHEDKQGRLHVTFVVVVWTENTDIILGNIPHTLVHGSKPSYAGSIGLHLS